MRILTVVGARPQFIKAALVSESLENGGHDEVLVHTGQHYDYQMSEVFFEELRIREPALNLGVRGATHGAQTGEMLVKLEEVMEREAPDRVLVYGDTNSTLAGALAAAKLKIPLVHVESGLRSFNRGMPEEVNRIVTDHVSNLLFCPSEAAVRNLETEGIRSGVHRVRDVMAETLTRFVARARSESSVLDELELKAGVYLLATVHRAESTDEPRHLRSILSALDLLGSEQPVILLAHPRTQRLMTTHKLSPESFPRIRFVPPVGYVDMLALQASARMILTDSGGLQKEAYWLGIPCITLRNETEWVETVDNGWNILAGYDERSIVEHAKGFCPAGPRPPLYVDGLTTEEVVTVIERLAT